MKDKEIESAVKKADELFSQGRWRESLEEYRRVLEIDPNNAGARKSVVNICLKRGDFSNAVQEYLDWAEIVKAQGNFSDANSIYQELLLLETAIEKKSFLVGQKGGGEGITQIKQLIQKIRPQVLIEMGKIYLQLDALEDAIQHLEAGVEADPANVIAHLALGQAYIKKGKDREAVGEFQEVVRLSPEEAAFAYEMLGEIFLRSEKPLHTVLVWFKNAGDLYFKKEKFSDAVRVYERILSLEPNERNVLSRLGEVYASYGDRKKAALIYEKLAQLFKKDGLLDKVVVLYEKIVEWNPEDRRARQELIAFYQQVLDQDPSNLNARNKLIGHFLKMGKAQEAITEFLLLAGAYVEKGMLEEGEQVCRKLLELDSQNLGAREILAQVYLRRKQQSAAIKEYFQVVDILKSRKETEKAHLYVHKLLNLFPDSSEVHYFLANSHKERGESKEALRELEEVLKKDPSYLFALFGKAEILESLKRVDEAGLVLQQIISLKPQDLELKERFLGCQLNLGHFEQAKEVAEQVSLAYLAKGDFSGALRAFNQVLAYIPEDRELRSKLCEVKLAKGESKAARDEYLFLANLYQKDELWEPAKRVWERILELSPQDLAAHYRLSKINVQLGFLPEAQEKLVQLADIYRAKNLTDSAVNVLEELLSLDPDNTRFRREFIDLLLKQMKFDEASVHFKQLLRTYLNQGELKDAETIAKELIALHPFDLDLKEDLANIFIERSFLVPARQFLSELSNTYLQQGEMEKGMELLEKVSELFKQEEDLDSYWEVKEKMVNIFFTGGWRSKAISEAKKVIVGELKEDLAKRAGQMIRRLVEFYLKEEQTGQAIDLLFEMADGLKALGEIKGMIFIKEQTVEFLTDFGQKTQAAQVLLDLGATYNEQEQYADALRVRKQALEIYKQLGEKELVFAQYLPLIDLYLKEGEPEAAQELYQLAGEQKPQEFNLKVQMADLLYQHGYRKESAKLFDEILKVAPDNSLANRRLAVIYLSRDDFGRAIEMISRSLGSGESRQLFQELEKALAEKYSPPEVAVNLGKIYQALGFIQEALKSFQAAAQKGQNPLLTFSLIGQLFKAEGRIELAIKEFQEGLKVSGSPEEEYLDLRYNLALTYQEEGMLKDALNGFQECYAVDIRFKDVAERIKQLSKLAG